MDELSVVDSAKSEGLRQRNIPVQASSSEEARQTVLHLNELEEKADQDDSEKKTFGRTPSGTVFTVPETHDMVSQLLSPKEPKNLSDLFVITVLGCHVFLLWALPISARVPVFGILFCFWRACYNIGIGWLLQKQSNQQTMVRWARRSKLFTDADLCPHPRLRAFIKQELETKVVKDYKFDEAPIEYNTWLVFRRIVDLILMCDFVSYSLFAIACSNRPHNEALITTASRWIAGIALFLFNLWVKLDAHRVVKDYAWYWGDFFFLVDQQLTFDGVFEMAPHPMYSIGYVGFYGISLMAASHKVMFISIFAHAAQFAFLVLVENPHIEKTYNSPPPRRQIHELPKVTEGKLTVSRHDTANAWPNPSRQKPPATHNLLGLQNLDLYRVTDTSIILIQILFLTLTLVTPASPTWQALYIANAIIWRLWYSIGIGYLLNRQSEKKKWTRHFLKYGESTGEAWRQWKATYHLSMTLCYASFVGASWKMYTAPSRWDDGLVLLKHTIGLSLVALQLWVAVSIHESLGEFGWFFGDFFFDHQPKLTYGGIYRFLNNPERVLGLAGVWGIALITDSKAIFCLALLSHTLSLLFIQFVERPHMQKLYGRHMRQDSGLVRSLKRSLPPPLRQWQDSMDKMLGEAIDTIEDFLDAAKPKLEAGFSRVIRDTRISFSKYPAHITMTKIDPEIVGLAHDGYEIQVLMGDNTGAPNQHHDEMNGNDRLQLVEYGTPLKIKWTAPLDHSARDWIGLYKVTDNSSREITYVSSQGRWIATNPSEYDVSTSEQGLITSDTKTIRITKEGQEVECLSGEMVFAGDKLWWAQGVFEFRYHHNGKHNVMARSSPFEIIIPKFSEDDLDWPQESESPNSWATENEEFIRQSIEKVLLPLVQNSFDQDPNIAPNTPQETFGGLVERDGKYARRVVYAIQQMFGIEFASQVVKADGKVENLAWRIWEAKKVLAPYSMSKSRGTATPVEEDRKHHQE